MRSSACWSRPDRALLATLTPNPDAETPLQKLVALLLECYGDEWLVIPAMHYRWSVLDQQYDVIIGKLSAPEASLAEQVALGEKISAPFRGSIAAGGQRYIHSYAQWMFQRPLDHYQALAGEARRSADALLRRIGAFDALNTKLNHRVKRRPGQLELVEETG